MKIEFAGKARITNGIVQLPRRSYNGELDKDVETLENKIFKLKTEFENKHNVFIILHPNEITAVIDFDNSVF
jgi:hypothetical protein